ncbi:MAG: hypothetical protein JW706_07880 [Opitutales bacterium]|nr:hypothetical protein [Opitutales bacterium]
MKTDASVNDAENVDIRLSRMVRDARLALLGGKTAYVLALSSDWVTRFPGLVEVRRLLWEARIKQQSVGRHRTTIGMRFRKWLAGCILPGMRRIKRDPKMALAAADRVLAIDPQDRNAILTTVEASKAIGWIDTALMACESLMECRDCRPADVVKASGICLEYERLDEAVRICESGMLRFSGDPAVRSALRKASVRRSMSSAAKWGRDSPLPS